MVKLKVRDYKILRKAFTHARSLRLQESIENSPDTYTSLVTQELIKVLTHQNLGYHKIICQSKARLMPKGTLRHLEDTSRISLGNGSYKIRPVQND